MKPTLITRLICLICFSLTALLVGIAAWLVLNPSEGINEYARLSNVQVLLLIAVSYAAFWFVSLPAAYINISRFGGSVAGSLLVICLFGVASAG